MSFKISPLILFLILLIVLVISVIFGKLLNLEGFVSFAQSKNSSETINIPQYSSSTNVYKLYDNIFVDNKNANLIEVDSTTYVVGGNTDLSGTTITKIYATSRDGDTKSYASVVTNGVVSAVDTDKSLIKTKTSSYHSLSYQTQSGNTDKYSVLYIPWDTNTYIHVINNTNNTNIGTFLFGSGSVMDQILYTDASTISITNSITDKDSDINTLVKDTVYDANKYLYKLSTNVKYDISNANLIIKNSDGSSTIYDRSKRSYEIKTGSISESAKTAIALNTVSNIGYNSWVVTDSVGQKIVLYCSSAINTIVAIVNYNSTTKQYYLANVARFNSSTLVNGNKDHIIPLSSSCSGPSSTSGTTTAPVGGSTPSLPGEGTDSYMSEYFKWYWFWKNNSGSSSTNPNDQFSEDYILKTQIVPPVCPSCPSCPSCSSNTTGNVCANCGGNGGSGTLSTDGKTVVSDTSKDKNIVSTAVGGAVGLGKDAVGGAVGLTKDTVKGAVGLGKDAVGGAVDLTKDAVGGAVGLVKDTVGGAVGLAKDVLSPNPMYIGQTINNNALQYGQPTYGTQTRNADIYSYYGALPSKSSNFMPITADFSSFGR